MRGLERKIASRDLTLPVRKFIFCDAAEFELHSPCKSVGDKGLNPTERPNGPPEVSTMADKWVRSSSDCIA